MIRCLVCLLIILLSTPVEARHKMGATVIQTGVSDTASYYANGRKITRDMLGRLYVVFTHKDNTHITQVYISVSDDEGSSWTELAQISDESYDQSAPSIAIDGNGCLHVVWRGCYAGSTVNSQIRYSQSEDYGQTWSAAVSISATTSYAQFRPAIAVDSADNIYVAWHAANAASGGNTQIYWSSSTDSGTTWGAGASIDAATSYIQENVSLAADGADLIHAVWRATTATSGGFYRIRLAIYNAGWGAAVEPTTGNYNQDYPCIATDAVNDSLVVWKGTHATSGGVDEIRFSAYTAGVGWSGIQNLSISTSNQTHPSISCIQVLTATPVDVIIVWSGPYTGPKTATATYNQIHEVRSALNRSVWSTTVHISQAKDYQRVPGLCWARWPVDGDTLQVVSPQTGYVCVWTDRLGRNSLQFYSSGDLAWYQQGRAVSRVGGISTGASQR